MPTMPGTLSSRNSGLGGAPSGSSHQASGNQSVGRFATSNLPAGVSQLSTAGNQGQSGLPNQSAMNTMGSYSFASSLSGVGGLVPGALPGSPLTNHASLSVAGISQSYVGGTGHAGSIGTIGGSIGRMISAGLGPNAPGLGGSRMNLGSNIGNSGLGIHGPGRSQNSMFQQATLNQGQVVSGSGQVGSMGLLNDGTAFDLNDFPQLTSRPSSAGGSQQRSLMPLRKHGSNQQSQEFSMQNEDFPALPGFKGGTVELTTDLHQKDQQNSMSDLTQSPQFLRGRSTPFSIAGSYVSHRQQQPLQIPGRMTASSSSGANATDLLHLRIPFSEFLQTSHGPSYLSQVQAVVPPGSGGGQVIVPSMHPGNTIHGLGTYEQQLIHRLQQQSSQSQFRFGSHQQQLPTIGQSRERSLKHMQGIRVAPIDQFGLLGLLNVIRMSDPDLTTLALGTDLTTLGLNLNSRENLYKTFSSPWAEGPIKGEPEFTLPECYIQQAPRLQPGYFSKFQQDTLFYVFYSMPSDEAQLYAANELYNRGWFYHKENHIWLTCVPDMEPLVKTMTYERGSYYFFDPNVWEIGRKDNFVLQYEMVEKRPHLPQ